MKPASPACLVLALLLAAHGIGTAQTSLSPDSAKRVAIRRLLTIERTDSTMLAGMDQAFAEQAAHPEPGLPAGFYDALRARIRRDVGIFVERLVPVYDSIFTASEVDQLIVFYQTPLGRRLLESQGALAAAAGDLGRQWGLELAGQVMIDLSRRPARP